MYKEENLRSANFGTPKSDFVWLLLELLKNYNKEPDIGVLRIVHLRLFYLRNCTQIVFYGFIRTEKNGKK